MQRDVSPIAVNTHYMPEAFATLPGIFRQYGVQVEVVHEDTLTGPFGGVIACRDAVVNADDILVFAGDGIYDADFAGMLAEHREREAELTVGVAVVDDGSQYGVISADSEGRVSQMTEKPPGVGSVQAASCGVYVVSKKLLARFTHAARPIDWVDVVRTLLEEGAYVSAAKVDKWHDVGTSNNLLRTNITLLASDEVSVIAEALETPQGSVWSQDPKGANLTNIKTEGRVLLGAGVDIESGAVISNSVVGPGARIETRARVANAVVLPGARVRAGTTVVNTVWG